jgi:hypothetical protein
VPASVQRLHRDDVRYVPIDAPGFVSPVIMSYRAGTRPPTGAPSPGSARGAQG